jgi:hypothetical protein
MAASVAAVAEAGHHDHVSFYSYSAPAVTVHTAHVVAAPVYYSAPVVVYQPAYVVPGAVTHVAYPVNHHVHYSVPAPTPITTVSHHSVGYAPMVPTVSSYYAPRFHRSHFHRGYPDEIEIEIKRKRYGYKIEVDYDD